MRNFAKFLLLAQSSSDAGKGEKNVQNNATTAKLAGYKLKDTYIRQAAAVARHLQNVRVTKNWDARFDMLVIYFDIKHVGQVSFHTFGDFPNIPEGGKWKGSLGESERVCKYLNKKYSLQHYKWPCTINIDIPY